MTPLRAEYWAGRTVQNTVHQEDSRVPRSDSFASWQGVQHDGPSVLCAARWQLGAADEFFAGISQRAQLHEEAAVLGGRVFDETFADLIARGAEEKTAHMQAVEAGQRAVQKLLSERPDEVEASIQAWRKQSTLQDDLDKQLPMASVYGGANKLMNQWYLCRLLPFSKTPTNIANEGMSRMGPAALLSPRFWSDWQKGGRHRDSGSQPHGFGRCYAVRRLRSGGVAASLALGRQTLASVMTSKARGWQGVLDCVLARTRSRLENVKRLTI